MQIIVAIRNEKKSGRDVTQAHQIKALYSSTYETVLRINTALLKTADIAMPFTITQ